MSLIDELAGKPGRVRELLMQMIESFLHFKHGTKEECLREALDWWEETYADCPFAWSEDKAAGYLIQRISKLAEEIRQEMKNAHDRTFSRN